MKKCSKLFILTTLLACLMLTGCNGKGTINTSDKRVLDAIDVLGEHWSKVYKQDESIEDKRLEIVNTRIITIRNNINPEDVHGEDLFNNIDYIVEFELLSNYLNTSPYIYNISIGNCVVVYKDGTSKVSNNLFNIYRANAFSNDFSPIIESIENFNSQYDQVLIIE